MNNSHAKVRAILKLNAKSVRAGAQECGLKYTTFNAALNNQSELGISTLNALCATFHVSLDYFACDVPVDALDHFTKDTKQDLTMQLQGAGYVSFVHWWHRCQGRIDDLDQLGDRVDFFDVPGPTDSTIRPVKIGAQSLQTLSFQSRSVDDLRDTLAGFTKARNIKLLKAHISTAKRNAPRMDHVYLKEHLPSGAPVRESYIRFLAPFYLPGGRCVIGNFSERTASPGGA